MKKYFKPLDWKFPIPVIGIICWSLIFILFPVDIHILPLWLEIIFFVSCVFQLFTYVKWDRIQIKFDCILNIIYSKKLAKIHKENIHTFYYNSKHTKWNDVNMYFLEETSLFQSYRIIRVCTKYVNNKIKFCIELKRPRFLIGKRGRNIEEIQKELGLDIHIIESKDIWRTQNNIF